MVFQPGKSGNPGGRARERVFTDALRMELAAAGDDNKALRAIAKNLINLAQKDDEKALPAINAIADRLEGKPVQAVIGGGEDDPAISIIHRIERVIVENSADTDSEGIQAAS
jgi:hypothetical protein